MWELGQMASVDPQSTEFLNVSGGP